jgi:MFS family permease
VRTLFIGAALTFIGYAAMWITVKQLFSHDVTILGVGALVMGQGSGWIYTVALNTNAANFRKEDRGKVVGTLTCSFALCSGIFTEIYSGFFGTDVERFLLFLAIVVPTVAMTLVLFLNVLPDRYRTYDAMVVSKRAMIAYMILGVIALYICIASLVQNFSSVSAQWLCIGMLATLFLLFLVPFRTGTLFHPVDDDVPLLDEREEQDDAQRDEDINIGIGTLSLTQCLRNLDYWLLFLISGVVIGTGVTALNNIADIVTSRETVEPFVSYQSKRLPHHKEIQALVSLYSIFNAVGRLASGYFSDNLHLQHRSRAWLLIAASAVMCAAQLAFAWAGLDILYLLIVLVGISEGICFTVVPALCLDLFGLKHFGANWSFLTIGSAIISVALGTYVAGYFR